MPSFLSVLPSRFVVAQLLGCASSVEPAYSNLAAHHSGNPGLRRGDILAVIIMPDGHIAVLDCVVTHPAGSSYLPNASQTAGFAAARAEQLKHTDFEQFGQGAGYEFVPVAIESYRRLGHEASRFLLELGNIAASDGHVRKGAFVRSVQQELSSSCAPCPGNCATYFQTIVLGGVLCPGWRRELTRQVTFSLGLSSFFSP